MLGNYWYEAAREKFLERFAKLFEITQRALCHDSGLSMGVLAIALLKVYFEQEILLENSVLLPNRLLSVVFTSHTSISIKARKSVLRHSRRIKWCGGEILEADRQHVFLHPCLIFSLLTKLDSIVVVILGILFEGRIVANDTVASMAVSL